MATIGRLDVQIAANVASLQRDMRQATGTIQRSTQQMTRMIKGVAIAFAGMFSVRAIQGSIKEVMRMADETAKLSQSVGISVETLSSFRHAADLSGTSINQVATGLGQLSRNMQNTMRDTGEARHSFEALGISVTGADGQLRAADDVLGDIADRFAGMEDGAQKTAMAMEIFGRSGRDLIPMLNQGREGLGEMRAEAERLGLVLSTEMAQQAERVNDNMTRMAGIMRGVVIGAVDALLPTLENLTNIFAQTTVDQEKAAEAGEKLATALRLLVSAGTVVAAVFRTLGEFIGMVAASMTFLFERKFREAYNVIQQFSDDQVDYAQTTIEKLNRIWDEGAERAVGAGIRMRQAMEGIGDGPSVDVKSTPEQLASMEAYLNHALQFQVDYARQIEKENIDAELIHQLRMGHLAEEEQRRQAHQQFLLRQLQEEVREEERAAREKERIANRWMDSVEANFLSMADVGLSSLRSLEDALVDTAMTGKFEFRDMADSIIRDLMRIMIQQSITQPLGSWMGGFSLFSAKGHAFDGGHVQAYARGGVVNAPTMFGHSGGAGLMGEAGPEAILPLTRVGGDLGVKAQTGTQDVRIYVHNESGQKMQATDSKVSFDAQGMIIDLWIDGFQRNKHGLRNMLGA